ncbi:MAG: hypothetical protein EAZ99_03500 [Alphaproteobacteria bacterium]|nr:MAG: hypothetical protein EAZ99_03500 [Alphaproteobacteria bacterium]
MIECLGILSFVHSTNTGVSHVPPAWLFQLTHPAIMMVSRLLKHGGPTGQTGLDREVDQDCTLPSSRH